MSRSRRPPAASAAASTTATSMRSPGSCPTQVEHHALAEAVLQRHLVDRLRRLALARREVVPRRVHVRPGVRRERDHLVRPPLPVGQVIRRAAEDPGDDRQRLRVVLVVDPRRQRVGQLTLELPLHRGLDRHAEIHELHVCHRSPPDSLPRGTLWGGPARNNVSVRRKDDVPSSRCDGRVQRAGRRRVRTASIEGRGGGSCDGRSRLGRLGDRAARPRDRVQGDRQGTGHGDGGRSCADLGQLWPFSNIPARSSWRIGGGLSVDPRITQVSGHTPSCTALSQARNDHG